MSGSMKTLKSAMQAADQRAAAEEAGVLDQRQRAAWSRRGRRLLVSLQVLLIAATWSGLGSLVWYLEQIKQGPVQGWPGDVAVALGLPSHESRTITLGNLVLRPGELDLQILFAPGSADLSREARRNLATLGVALKGPAYRDRTIQIIGHADSVGDEAENLALSTRRAAQVRAFLIRETGLPAARLIAIGRGEAVPADPARPNAPLNRRVQIVVARLIE